MGSERSPLFGAGSPGSREHRAASLTRPNRMELAAV